MTWPALPLIVARRANACASSCASRRVTLTASVWAEMLYPMKEPSLCSASLELLMSLVLVAGLLGPPLVVAGTNTFNEKLIKQWTLKGPLSDLRQRVSEVLPLSDQQNKAGWVKFEPMWDEFDQATLDTNKWTVGMSWWQGREPAWFNPRNVVVRNGQLHLTMRREEVPADMQGRGYHDYTSAALHSKARSSYGYYEVKARPMNSGGSSAFWFQQEDLEGVPRLGHRDRRVRVVRQVGRARQALLHDLARFCHARGKTPWVRGHLLGITSALRGGFSCFRARLGSEGTALVN